MISLGSLATARGPRWSSSRGCGPTSDRDHRTRQLESVVAKTVAVFMNAHGGTLVIGVDDYGNPGRPGPGTWLRCQSPTWTAMSCSCVTFLILQLAATVLREYLSNFPLWTESKCAHCVFPQRHGPSGSASETTRYCTSVAATPRDLSMVKRHTATSLPIGGSERRGATSFARGPARLRHHCARGLTERHRHDDRASIVADTQPAPR